MDKKRGKNLNKKHFPKNGINNKYHRKSGQNGNV